MAENKSPYRSALEAMQRFKKRAEDAKERGETLMGEGMRTVVSGVTAFGAGLADQRFGSVDQTTGIRVHKTNGAPTVLLAAAALKGAAAFGLFGKQEVAGFAAGDGAFASAANTWGRMAGERMRVKAEVAETATKAAEVSKTETATAETKVA